MTIECKDCKHDKTCNRVCGLMFGFCRFGEPKQEVKEKLDFAVLAYAQNHPQTVLADCIIRVEEMDEQERAELSAECEKRLDELNAWLSCGGW